MIIILVIFVIGLLVYKELNKETVIIEPFQVPTDLERQNITGQAIVNKLLDQIEIINANADTAYKKLDVKPVLFDSQLEIVIPGSGISLKSLLQNVKNFLGKKQTRISGEVVLNNQKLYLTIRVFGEPSKTFSGSLNELDEILKEASQYILKFTQPYLLAYYLYYNYDAKNKEAAMDMIKYTLSHEPRDDDAMAYNLDGFIKYEDGDLVEATKLFNKAIDIDPKNVDAINNLAYILYDNKNYDSAISLYKKSAEINPNYFYTYHYWGLALAAQKKFDEAFKMYDKSIKLNPQYTEIYDDYGKALYEIQKYDEAAEKFERAIELDPKNSANYRLAGSIFAKQKKYEDAIDMFEKSIEQDSGFYEVYIDFGNVLLEQSNYTEAENKFRKAIKLKPENADAYRKLALALEKQNNYPEAVSAYKKLFIVSPGDSVFVSEKINELKILNSTKK